MFQSRGPCARCMYDVCPAVHAGHGRKQVYIEPTQQLFLKRRARELGVTEAELIRSAIDSLARVPAHQPFDPEAWGALLVSMDERASFPTIGEGRVWTRADMYAERLGRLSG